MAWWAFKSSFRVKVKRIFYTSVVLTHKSRLAIIAFSIAKVLSWFAYR
jgi:hypothetical protein